MSRFRLSQFRDESEGSSTIEFVIWLLFFLLVFVLILDLSILFMNHARISQLIITANRSYAVGTLRSCDEVQDWLRPRVRQLAPSAEPYCNLIIYKAPGSTVPGVKMAVTEVRAPSGELDVSGASGIIGDMQLRVEGRQRLESWL